MRHSDVCYIFISRTAQAAHVHTLQVYCCGCGDVLVVAAAVVAVRVAASFSYPLLLHQMHQLAASSWPEAATEVQLPSCTAQSLMVVLDSSSGTGPAACSCSFCSLFLCMG